MFLISRIPRHRRLVLRVASELASKHDDDVPADVKRSRDVSGDNGGNASGGGSGFPRPSLYWPRIRLCMQSTWFLLCCRCAIVFSWNRLTSLSYFFSFLFSSTHNHRDIVASRMVSQRWVFILPVQCTLFTQYITVQLVPASFIYIKCRRSSSPETAKASRFRHLSQNKIPREKL